MAGLPKIGRGLGSKRSRSRAAFFVACSRETLPFTVVIASTLSSGERRANTMAKASSTPGSVSIITRFCMAEMMWEGFRIFWLTPPRAVVNWQKPELPQDSKHF
jgi:hypothetical protein